MNYEFIESNLKELFGNQPVNIALTMAMIESYGNSMYNKALEDAAENATAKIVHEPGFRSLNRYPTVDKQSILNLKKQ